MRAGSSSAGTFPKWIVIAIIALCAVLAWNTYRKPQDTLGTPTSTTASAADAGSTQPSEALEMPPAMPPVQTRQRQPDRSQVAYPDFLPPEAIDTLTLIARGGPYPYRQDDGTFGNRERRLPPQTRGYYREYTVKTPGSRDRGARRIIAGGQPPVEYFYTDDHYRSFRRFTLDGLESRP